MVSVVPTVVSGALRGALAVGPGWGCGLRAGVAHQPGDGDQVAAAAPQLRPEGLTEHLRLDG
jgi:hypothetical protein